MAKTNKSAGGVGESKNFGAPAETKLPSAVDRMLACHIDGRPIADMKLDISVLTALPYDATDEGIAEAAARPGPRSSGATVGAEPFEKSLEQRRNDVLERGMQSFEARDPLKEVADKYAKPGMKAKFVSAGKYKENGGAGIYEIVTDAKGDPVKVKGMILAHAPIQVTEARNKHYAKINAQRLKQVGDQYKKEGGSTAVVDQGNV